MRSLIRLLPLVALAPLLTGFVLLSNKKATLPATAANPTVTFIWDEKAPEDIKQKDKYRGGAYQHLSNTEFMRQLLTDALDIWNKVPGSFIVLAIQDQTTAGQQAQLDKSDKQFSIVTEHSDNLSSAAFAAPNIPADSETIDDCDISISDKATEAKELAFTITHELGHCLGLGHAHSNYNAIMSYSRMARDLSLGADDMAGVIYLYPDPAEYDGQVKEMVAACGSVGASVATDPASAAGLLALLLAPLAAACAARWRRKPAAVRVPAAKPVENR